MKKTFFCLLSAFFCAACAGVQKSGGSRPAAEDHSVMSFTVPKGWKLSQDNPQGFTLTGDEGLLAVILEDPCGLGLEETAYALALGMEAESPARDGAYFLINLPEGRSPGREDSERKLLVNQANGKTVILFLYDPNNALLSVARDLMRSIEPHSAEGKKTSASGMRERPSPMETGIGSPPNLPVAPDGILMIP